MSTKNAKHEIEKYTSYIVFPVTKEELINGLLVAGAPGRAIALVERLLRDRYDDRQQLKEDLREVSRVHAREVAQASTYDEYLGVVLRHVGDVRHATKEAYNRIVEHVIHTAQYQRKLDKHA